jgi:hypothetical protein
MTRTSLGGRSIDNTDKAEPEFHAHFVPVETLGVALEEHLLYAHGFVEYEMDPDSDEYRPYFQGVEYSMLVLVHEDDHKENVGGGNFFCRHTHDKGQVALPVPFDVAAHIQSAFEGHPVGTFLSIAQIVAPPPQGVGRRVGAGAVAARLFPAIGPCKIPGIRAGTGGPNNVRGAYKEV